MGSDTADRVGAILLHHGKVDEDVLAWALNEGRRCGLPLLTVLRRAGLIDVFDAVFALLEQASVRLSGRGGVGAAFRGLRTRV